MNGPMEPAAYKVRPIHPGRADGLALVTGMSVSFWGGIDPTTGMITDVHHELCGTCITGTVFVFPRGSGSSSGCGVLMEMVRRRTNPAAIVNMDTEVILALGPIISDALYGRSFPIVTAEPGVFHAIRSGDYVRIDADTGRLSIEPRAVREIPTER